MTPTLTIAAAGATAEIALIGAEPVSWTVGGKQLLWSGDPAHWNRHAPILFPVVGAVRDGLVRVDGRAYPMPRHGFARDSRFEVVDRTDASVRLRLADTAASRAHFPFAFRLDVDVSLGADGSLAVAFSVANPGAAPLPYALGFHPAFPWPLEGDGFEDHAVVFERPETPAVPRITEAGLLTGSRPVPLEGARLVLDPALFADDALVFLDAASARVRFEAPSGAALTIEAEDFPHWALWTKPGSPFLSVESWTGHADPEGFSGELDQKPSMRLLAPGGRARHALRLSWRAMR